MPPVWTITGILTRALTVNLQSVYREAFLEPPYTEGEVEAAAFGERLPDHSRLSGFRLIVAGESPVVGFAYGYDATADPWWRGLVARQLPAAEAWWLEDAFSLVELAVLPSWRGGGLGRALHDALLASTPRERGLLTTFDADTAARRLYLQAGWEVIVWPFVFPDRDDPYVLMGRRLRGGV